MASAKKRTVKRIFLHLGTAALRAATSAPGQERNSRTPQRHSSPKGSGPLSPHPLPQGAGEQNSELFCLRFGVWSRSSRRSPKNPRIAPAQSRGLSAFHFQQFQRLAPQK